MTNTIFHLNSSWLHDFFTCFKIIFLFKRTSQWYQRFAATATINCKHTGPSDLRRRSNRGRTDFRFRKEIKFSTNELSINTADDSFHKFLSIYYSCLYFISPNIITLKEAIWREIDSSCMFGILYLIIFVSFFKWVQMLVFFFNQNGTKYFRKCW